MNTTIPEIKVKATHKSKAKILGKSIKSVLVGHKYDLYLEFTNVGSTISPEGTIRGAIDWPGDERSDFKIEIPQLGLGETYKNPPITMHALSRGFGSLGIWNRISKDGEDVVVYFSHYKNILAKEPQEIFEYWGMLIAAGSLAFLVGIEFIRFLIWLGSLLK